MSFKNLAINSYLHQEDEGHDNNIFEKKKQHLKPK